MRFALWFALALLLATTVEARYEDFEKPSIKDDFCGASMDFRYCKCAFHNDYCKDIDMTKQAASTHVFEAYDVFVQKQVEAFARQCMSAGGIYSVYRYRCEYCEGGKIRSDGVCKNPNDIRSIEEIYNLPKDMGPPKPSSIIPVAYLNGAEGEVFIYNHGRGKWIGPVKPGLAIFEGDEIRTLVEGRAEIVFGGSSRLYLAERTTIVMPVQKEEQSFLKEGALYIWAGLKRLAANEPFEVQTAHSVSGTRGTQYLVVTNEEGDTYAVKEGTIGIRASGGRTETSLAAGKTATVTGTTVEPSTNTWDDVASEHGFTNLPFKELEEFTAFAPIDPDAIDPSSAAYSGNIYGGLDTQGSSRWWLWPLLALLVGAGYVAYSRTRKPQRRR